MSEGKLFYLPFKAIAWSTRKIKNQSKIKKDHENKHFAISCIEKIEGYEMKEIIYDSFKHAKRKYKDVIDSLETYAYKKLDNRQKNEIPLLFLVELENGTFRGMILPRYVKQNNVPIFDSEAKAFTIDHNHGLQFVEDERTQNHQVFFREISIFDGDEIEAKIWTLRYENFFTMWKKFEWTDSFTDEEQKKNVKRFLMIHFEPTQELKPLFENEARKRNLDFYVDTIKNEFEIDIGSIHFDSAYDPRRIEDLARGGKGDYALIAEHWPEKTIRELFIGFIAGPIYPGKWIVQPDSAIAYLKFDENGKIEEKIFCPNRLPHKGCFMMGNYEQSTEFDIHFTSEYNFDAEIEQMRRRNMREYDIFTELWRKHFVGGFEISGYFQDFKIDFNQNESFYESKKDISPGQFGSYSKANSSERIMLFHGMNVNQLKEKLKKALSES